MFFSITYKFLQTLTLCKVSEKGNNPFWIYSTENREKWKQNLQRKEHNVGKRYNNDFNTAY